MSDLQATYALTIDALLNRRNVTEKKLRAAFRSIPREAFVPDDLADFASDDASLPLCEGHSLIRPCAVALAIDALTLTGTERVLEIGTGTGYSAAILSRMAADVSAVESVPWLAKAATERLAALRCTNVRVRWGDASLGWPEHGPYDAILVGPEAAEAAPNLMAQLAVGGRLVVSAASEDAALEFLRVTRDGATSFREERISEHGTIGVATDEDVGPAPPPSPGGDTRLLALLSAAVEPIDDIETFSMDALLDRIADARLVLLGSASCGTSEFYRMRARITRELIVRRGFRFVAVDADWPDAARVDEYVQGDRRRSSLHFAPFVRFPSWVWRNEDVHAFIAWLRDYNTGREAPKVGFHGLDLYGPFTSMAAVLAYLDRVDPDSARVARHRYGLLTPWQRDPAAYGHAALSSGYTRFERAVVTMLRELLARRVDYARRDAEAFFDAARNAVLLANAERYYRELYYGAADSRDRRSAHMFETLQSLLAFYGPESRGVVWAHNAQVGDSRFVDLNTGESTLGSRCRAAMGRNAVYVVGFGTDHGRVAAAPSWEEAMEPIEVVTGRAGSYERLFHQLSRKNFTLPLTDRAHPDVRAALSRARLERAIGLVYRPSAELESHYVRASLSRQFDELAWFDVSHAVVPLSEASATSLGPVPPTYPFGW
jgi:protein-L-isoaspartate(D-aspartate) O-methyltransferase